MAPVTKVDGATELVARPSHGRTFSRERRVRLADTTTDGVLRLDALARFVQDVASDDARETMPDDYLAWVVRRTLVTVDTAPISEELCTLTTWCSGYGSRWAERRTSLRGDGGGRCETAVVWVAIDTRSGTPTRLPESFTDIYDEAASGRRVTARLRHPPPPAEATASPWSFRSTDLDRLGHVNNAAYWVLAEELLAERSRPSPLGVELEYREPVPPGADLEIRTVDADGQTSMWLCGNETIHASLVLTDRPPEDTP